MDWQSWHSFYPPPVQTNIIYPMEQYEVVDGIVNGLIQINNDRIAGYERATNDAGVLDTDIKATFKGMIRQSKANKDELSKYVRKIDDVVGDETTISGNIYQAWMDIKGGFAPVDRHSILESCEFAEDAAQRAYASALNAADLHDEAVRQVIASQKASLKISQDLIKAQRNAHRAPKK